MKWCSYNSLSLWEETESRAKSLLMQLDHQEEGSSSGWIALCLSGACSLRPQVCPGCSFLLGAPGPAKEEGGGCVAGRAPGSWGGARFWKVESAYGGCEGPWLWCWGVIGSKSRVSFSGPHLHPSGNVYISLSSFLKVPSSCPPWLVTVYNYRCVTVKLYYPTLHPDFIFCELRDHVCSVHRVACQAGIMPETGSASQLLCRTGE